MSLRCSDNPERRLTLKGGASALRLEQKCHIKADGWSISSVALVFLSCFSRIITYFNTANTPFQNDFPDHAGYTPEKSCSSGFSGINRSEID